MCNYQPIVLIDNNIQTNGQRRNWVKKRKSNFVDIMPNSVMLSWKKANLVTPYHAPAASKQ